MKNSIKQSRGFTLIEAVSALAISSAVAMLSLPMVDEFQQKRVAAGLQERFSSALTLARSSAAALGKTVGVCASADGETCDAGQWEEGWLIYVDSGSADIAIAAEHRLQSYQVPEGAVHLTVTDEMRKAVESIRFDARGFNLAEQRLSASVCREGELAQLDAISVERSGRVRLANAPADASDADASTICRS